MQYNDHDRGKKILKHKGCPGYPGPDWLKDFIGRNKLSLKEATKLSVCRYNATKNPFIIYNYFDIVEETINKLGLADRPDLIWNCDESGMPSEPRKCRVVSAKGQKILQVNMHSFFRCILVPSASCLYRRCCIFYTLDCTW